MSTAHEIPAHSSLGFECSFGHPLHALNTGWVAGEPYCLDCAALANLAYLRGEQVVGSLIAVLLNLAPFPSREEIGL